MKDSITLIGMPGCGKSSVGIVLAKALGYAFTDTDLLIQAREKRLLCQLIETEGLERFKQIEEDVISSIEETSGTVIATGGSAVYGTRAMEHLREFSTVIYLELPLEEVVKRLGDLNRRGVAVRPGQTLADLYAERVPLYERYADITIDEEHMDIKQTVGEIMRAVGG